MSCPLCSKHKLLPVYEVKDIPVFQNKVYDTVEQAKNTQLADVSLVVCENCGFIFNNSFNPQTMNYDVQYQNEQSHSIYFQNYLNNILKLFISKGFQNKKIVEIGCGKGYFLEKLEAFGFDIIGFDPAYEGINPRIIKDYFSNKYNQLNTDLIILRHTLEHIQNPLEFLHYIARSVDYKGKIFIEVPSFEWIIQKTAFWDIFYEHCNYFTFESLGSLFEVSDQGSLFCDQYMYLLADLSSLKEKIEIRSKIIEFELLNTFNQSLEYYRRFAQAHNNIYVWGAGAKRVTFANLVDPHQTYISHIIDINPKKQGKYIGKTAHNIASPEILNEVNKGEIFIMNENYYEEIRCSVNNTMFNFHILGVVA